MRVHFHLSVAVGLATLAIGTVGATPALADPSISECDVVGTSGDDVIYGYDFPYWPDVVDVIYADPDMPEIICGLGGNDRIIAFDGDTVYGGPGDDELWNGAAARRMYGGDGDDRLVSCIPYGCDGTRSPAQMYGGSGSDTLVGKGGKDVLYGGDGDDLLLGYGGDDRLYGGAGADVLKGWWGYDHLYGGAGPDELGGGKNNDVLSGGAGRDKLWGAAGRDQMSGNRGADVLFARDRRADRLDGGPGYDKGDWDPGLDRVRSVEARK